MKKTTYNELLERAYYGDASASRQLVKINERPAVDYVTIENEVVVWIRDQKKLATVTGVQLVEPDPDRRVSTRDLPARCLNKWSIASICIKPWEGVIDRRDWSADGRKVNARPCLLARVGRKFVVVRRLDADAPEFVDVKSRADAFLLLDLRDFMLFDEEKEATA